LRAHIMPYFLFTLVLFDNMAETTETVPNESPPPSQGIQLCNNVILTHSSTVNRLLTDDPLRDLSNNDMNFLTTYVLAAMQRHG
jgi:hypothetical protein